MGRKIQDYIHSDDVPILVEALTRLISGGSVRTTILRVKHSEGNWRWLECHGILVVDAKGQRMTRGACLGHHRPSGIGSGP